VLDRDDTTNWIVNDCSLFETCRPTIGYRFARQFVFRNLDDPSLMVGIGSRENFVPRAVSRTVVDDIDRVDVRRHLIDNLSNKLRFVVCRNHDADRVVSVHGQIRLY
jgi:hypothetical protein